MKTSDGMGTQVTTEKEESHFDTHHLEQAGASLAIAILQSVGKETLEGDVLQSIQEDIKGKGDDDGDSDSEPSVCNIPLRGKWH